MSCSFTLFPEFFAEKEKTLLEYGSLKASAFVYSSGIEAIRVENDIGYAIILPFMGQMIWDMEFYGKKLVMRSIYEEPQVCSDTYGESYGCFLMHCGLSAMGNPTKEDHHKPHGELPIAKYQKAYLRCGQDEKGRYISVGGVYSHKRAFEMNYDFSPECRLYEGSGSIEITVDIKNNKDLPLEYFYLCHINWRPVDGAILNYTAKHENIVAHREVPENYPPHQKKKTEEYIHLLESDMSVMDRIDSKTQSYAPEIVFTCRYDADHDGNAYTMQLLPDGYACYVVHKPAELPFGIRWIARTEDEDALGMVLPATAEHKGYIYCKKNGYEKYLAPNETTSYHIRFGILTPQDSAKLSNKINYFYTEE